VSISKGLDGYNDVPCDAELTFICEKIYSKKVEDFRGKFEDCMKFEGIKMFEYPPDDCHLIFLLQSTNYTSNLPVASLLPSCLFSTLFPFHFPPSPPSTSMIDFINLIRRSIESPPRACLIEQVNKSVFISRSSTNLSVPVATLNRNSIDRLLAFIDRNKSKLHGR
jgi:hypothetical protein